MDKVQLTAEGFENVKKELEELNMVQKPKAVTRLQTARNMGDLRENSEYTSAKEQLAFIEGRIQELEQIMKQAEIITSNTNITTVDIGTRVVVKNNDNEEEYIIVGDFEADPMAKKLSTTSPIGKALFGKKIGETVEIEVPAGTLSYKILDIRRD